jgi:phenylacetate-CoA ligase
MSEIIIDDDRYPTLTAAGRSMLEFLREHPSAPIYRNQSGNRLTAADVDALRQFDREISAATVGWPRGAKPPWLEGFVARAFEDVPFYRALGSPPARFEDLPTVSRADLAGDIARFVPDSADIDRLIKFTTTGTSGHRLFVASHPVVAGRYLAFHKRALRRFGIELTYGCGQVGAVLVGFQRECFTYVSVTPLMDQSGFAKINLHPDDWRDPDDRARYLDALAPEVYAGDPISFAELANLPITTRPRALISVAMLLLPGLRQRLEQRFGCPVLDIYSLNEAGPVAVLDAAAGGHVLLQPMLYLEILDPQGRPVEIGVRGEIALTGGFNFCLPLLRYRTGDHTALSLSSDVPVLMGLSGRLPVRFRTKDGEWINNIDVTHAFDQLALSQFGLHQRADGSVILRLARAALPLADAARAALAPIFGAHSIALEVIPEPDKIIQYTSELDASMNDDPWPG